MASSASGFITWENTFQSWGKPPSTSEQEKCDNAVRAARKAIEGSEPLEGRSITVFAQGSYWNRTSVRADSDVDVCVLCTDSIFFAYPLESGQRTLASVRPRRIRTDSSRTTWALPSHPTLVKAE